MRSLHLLWPGMPQRPFLMQCNAMWGWFTILGGYLIGVLTIGGLSEGSPPYDGKPPPPPHVAFKTAGAGEALWAAAVRKARASHRILWRSILRVDRCYTWVDVKILIALGYPKDSVPYDNRNPERDHDFDNHPHGRDSLDSRLLGLAQYEDVVSLERSPEQACKAYALLLNQVLNHKKKDKRKDEKKKEKASLDKSDSKVKGRP